jgi:RHS repeat-associated protein
MTDSKKNITATEYGRANLPWVVFKNDKRIEYLYDAADQRIGKHIGDDRAATLSEEYYIRAGGLELAVYDYTQDEMTWYLHGSEREAKATAPAPADFMDDSRTAQPGLPALRWSFYLSDHLGNTRMVFSASCESHAVVYNYEFVADYTPYGRILRSTGHEKYQTTQHERDAETDLDYRGARFYDSDAGRFLSLDPLAAKYLALGAYVYVAGNPVIYTDPTGQFIIEEVDAKNYPELERFMGDMFNKFVTDGKLNQNFYNIYGELSGYSEQEVIDMLTPGCGPTLQFPDLSQTPGKLFIGAEDGKVHGYINGETPLSFDGDAQTNDLPVGYIFIDAAIMQGLAYGLGNTTAQSSVQLAAGLNAAEDDNRRQEYLSIFNKLFESTVLHEGVHYGRAEKGLPNRLPEAVQDTREPGKLFEVRYYGQDISERIDKTQYVNLPVKSINAKEDEH